MIVSGHSHTLLDTERNGVPIVQARNNGTAIGVVDIVRTAAGTRRIDVDVQTVWVDQVTPDSAIAGAGGAGGPDHRQPLEPRSSPTSPCPMTRTGDQYPLGNLMADAFRNVLRTDVALVNNGGIRADVAAGPLTYGQLFTVMPFQNQAVRVTITGKQLREMAEASVSASGPDAHVSGLRITYDSTRPQGQRVRDLRLANGKKPKDGDRYSLAANSFLSAGQSGYTMLRGAPQTAAGMSDIEVDGDLPPAPAAAGAPPGGRAVHPGRPMTDTIPVFVNERRLEVPRGATAADAAALLDPAFAARPGADGPGHYRRARAAGGARRRSWPPGRSSASP